MRWIILKELDGLAVMRWPPTCEELLKHTGHEREERAHKHLGPFGLVVSNLSRPRQQQQQQQQQLRMECVAAVYAHKDGPCSPADAETQRVKQQIKGTNGDFF